MKFKVLCFLLLPFVCNGQIISTFAGNGVNSYTGDGGPATAAAISQPGGIAFDAAGNVFFSGFSNNTIRQVAPSGIITTIGGNGTAGFSGDGGPATAARIHGPTKICRDAAGNIYIADQLNHRIRKISTTGVITTIAGNGSIAFGGDGGAATAASLNQPTGVAVDAAGNIYIADFFHHRVRKVTPAGIISTFVGNGTAATTGDGGPATSASINGPFSVVFDASGNLYLTEQYGAKVRKVTPAGIISTFAGTGTSGFGGDGGPATAASFNWPNSVAIDASGNFYISDFNNFRVRRIDPAGIISTFIGNGTAGFTGDGGPAISAQIGYSNEVVCNGSGQLFICDNANNRMRTISCTTPITTQPTNDTVVTGANATFSVVTSFPSFAYQWQEDTGTGFANLANVLPYSGVLTNTLTINNATISFNNRHYRCVISSEAACTDTSNVAILAMRFPASVAQFSGKDISITPNPANDYIIVTLPSGIDAEHFLVINEMGQVVLETDITRNANQINISNLPPQIYVLKMQFQGTSVYKKFVKL